MDHGQSKIERRQWSQPGIGRRRQQPGQGYEQPFRRRGQLRPIQLWPIQLRPIELGYFEHRLVQLDHFRLGQLAIELEHGKQHIVEQPLGSKRHTLHLG